MSGTPAPRPALRKAADAHIHPAAPGQRPVLLRHPDAPAAAAVPEPRATEEAAPEAEKPGRRRGAVVSSLSGPLGGHTSDSLRRPKGRAARAAKASGKKVELTVKIPKALRKEFKAAIKSERKDADAVVAALLRSWLDG